MRFVSLFNACLVALVLFAGTGMQARAERIVLGAFSAGDTQGWRNEPFDGIDPSRYDVAEVDGRTALRGRCDDSASVFVLEREVDLREHPVLQWSWRVDEVYRDIPERKKAGDDFPARVYVVVDGGLLQRRTRAVNYVWASRLEPGTAWPNPFSGRAMMVALQSGPKGEWVSESRNVREDLQRYFGRRVDVINGVAVMTDCDNHNGTGKAYFGDIYFTGDS